MADSACLCRSAKFAAKSLTVLPFHSLLGNRPGVGLEIVKVVSFQARGT